ncbi:hypothetical protein [Streptomyces sp. NPDC004014]
MKRTLSVLPFCRKGIVTVAVALPALVLPIAAAQSAPDKPVPSSSQDEPASCDGGFLDGVVAVGCKSLIQIL